MILIILLFNFLQPSYAQLTEAYKIQDPSKKFIKNFVRPEIVIDHVNADGYEVYGPAGLGSYLERMEIPFVDELEMLDSLADDHPTPEQFEILLQEAVKQCGSLAKMFSIGKSVKGRDLWFVKISDNVEQDETEPEFKYISSMHGDEITGRPMMLSLIQDLCQSYSKDQKITDLINNTEIYIMPSMNPDGSAARRRWNANGVDLNRNFPDFSVPGNNQNTKTGRAAETQAIMDFQAARQFSMSVNFHGGAEVVNYPWDTAPENFPFYNLVVSLSLDYAKSVPYIYNSSEFKNGITNGYEWYEVNGGMQDWSYYWHNDLQFTIELSNMKWATYSQMAYYYNENRGALIDFISAVHQGMGFVLEEQDVSGTVEVIHQSTNKSLGKYEFVRSEFYKVLDPGSYKFIVTPKKGTEKVFFGEVTPYNVVTKEKFATL